MCGAPFSSKKYQNFQHISINLKKKKTNTE